MQKLVFGKPNLLNKYINYDWFHTELNKNYIRYISWLLKNSAVVRAIFNESNIITKDSIVQTLCLRHDTNTF